ncbi:hypothetical protein P3T37_000333 [Kitasatospora sp. MAA4]|uniref:pPIWI_RE_Z domain-containing protein n=1 Tax=Kitasatospora sp. MAA4 TaxID=3035093 RepID=UPI002474ABFD|nr:hypothetical protein [Kitasatospora sp. MAA4]MDH6130966.1 hypothetical protein [Kitasatospora sp. MAA4]
MTRDITTWFDQLKVEADATGATDLVEPALSMEEFFRVELGLLFMAEFLPGEAALLLRKVLDGYLVSPELGAESVVRAVRRRMGATARGGQWKLRLNAYCQVPVHLRLFEPENSSTLRAVNDTVFRRRGSAVLPGRQAAYRQAMTAPVAYVAERVHEPAPPGARVRFKRDDRSTVRLRLPDWLPAPAPMPLLAANTSRTRRLFPPMTEDDLRQVAKEASDLLSGHPRYRTENFTRRVDNLVFARPRWDDVGGLEEGLGVFAIDGVAHIVGLMNAGKTTFNDLLVKFAVDRGLRVGYLVTSVGNALEKVRFFRALGIDAIPLIGSRSRTEHLDRYWDDQLYVAQEGQPAPLPEGDDAAADFATDLCMLESLLEPAGPVHEPLTATERPCRGKLVVESGKRRKADCPLLAVCPAQAAARKVPTAQVWVTTPAALLASSAGPASYKARWITAFQHDLDLVVADEADQVMTHFDTKFMHQEPLTAPDGWSSRQAVAWHEALGRTWYHAMGYKKGQRYQQYVNHHAQAMAGLLPLLLPPAEGQQDRTAGVDLLTEVVADGPFSGHTLLMQLARALHGITGHTEREQDSHLWQQAEEYFQEHFSTLVGSPFAAPPTNLRRLVDSMTAAYQVDTDAEDEAQAWVSKHAPAGLSLPPGRLKELGRLLTAGYWSARLTASVFELSSMQESIRSLMPMEDFGSLLKHQPPAELLAIVPEQPMGNMMALQWSTSPKKPGGALDVLWLRGVGRWLLYHLHDMLACEGIQGPHVVLSSATSSNPYSARYNIDINPTLILREPPDCTAALRQSRLYFRPRRRPGHERGIFVSGAGGRAARQAAVRTMTDAVCTPDPGAVASLLDQVLDGCDPDRRKALFVTLSTNDAETSALYMNTRTPVPALHVVPDKQPPGMYGLNHRRISSFPSTGARVMVAAEGSAGRGHNFLNQHGVAAIGAIFYLARLHPPPTDLGFPLAVLNSQAIHRLQRPVRYGGIGIDAGREMRALVFGARSTWNTMMGRPLNFRALRDAYLRDAFVSDQLSALYQTSGRGLRGNVPIRVYLLDAAFAPRAADPRDRTADTDRTSVLVASRSLVRRMLADPGPNADPQRLTKHAIATAVWGLASHLLETIDWG